MTPSESISSDRFLASSLLANWWPATTWFMARAMEFEKFLTNSPYFPSFEFLTSSRHRGLAMTKISSSVLSMMFILDSSRFKETGRVGLTEDDMLVLLVLANQV